MAQSDRNGMFFKRRSIGKSTVKAYVLDNLMCQGTPEDITEAVMEAELQDVREGTFQQKNRKRHLKSQR